MARISVSSIRVFPMKPAPNPALDLVILMPVYNGERFVAEALESILNQTYPYFIFKIIDDGSTDSTPEILDSYARRDSRIEITRQANVGVATTLKRACQTITTRYMARQDADDFSYPDRIERQIRYLEEHPEISLLGTSFEILHPDASLESYPLLLKHEQICDRFLRDNAFAHGSIMVRMKEFREIGFYDTSPESSHIEDYHAWVRLARRHRVANLPEVLYRYRNHGESISGIHSSVQSFNARQWASRILQDGYYLDFRKVNCFKWSSLRYLSTNPGSDPLADQRKRFTFNTLWHSARLFASKGLYWEAALRLVCLLWVDPNALLKGLSKWGLSRYRGLTSMQRKIR